MNKTSTPKPYPPLWEDLSLRPYLGEIARRHGIVETLALPSMRDLPPVRIEQLFVQPLLAEIPVSADSDPQSWPKGESLLEALEATPQLVVLGDPGGGKTTLANWLAWRLASGLTAKLPEVLSNRVPVPCVLRDMPADVFEADIDLALLTQNVALRLLGANAGPALLESLKVRVAKGEFVLILDGIDEIPIPKRKRIGAWIHHAADLGAPVLATSRFVGYEDWPVDRDAARLELLSRAAQASGSVLKTMSGLANVASQVFDSSLISAGRGLLGALDHAVDKLNAGEVGTPSIEGTTWAQRRYLLPFDQPRIDAFATNWYQQRCVSEAEARQKAEDLLASLGKSEVTRQLARTPNLLSLMAIVHRERTHLPDGKALLYEEIANAYINTIDSQRRIEPGDALAPYTWKERKAWLAYIGFRMQLRRGDSFGEDPEDRETGVLVDAQEVSNWLVEAMRASGVTNPETTATMYMHWVARRSGLLLPRGEGRYAFVHLSFQEYFCASYLADRYTSRAFVRDELPNDALVTRQRLREWSESAAWRETLVNLFELLSERDPEWTDDLADTLYGNHQVNTDLTWQQAPLAVRVFTDRHIRLNEVRKRNLAWRCAERAAGQWRNWRFAKEAELLLPMVEAGYAAVFSDTNEMETPAGLTVQPLSKIATAALEGKLVFASVKGDGFCDCAPLAGLEQLRSLDLSNTQVEDCTPLTGLKQLQSLSLHSTQVADCAPLSSLKQLQFLDLDNTQVADCTPLASLKQLQDLSLNSTQVANCIPLASLKQLRSLFLYNTPVTDCTPLAGLKQLQYLLLCNTQVADCTPLAGLNQLQYLDLSSSQMADCAPLAGLYQLQHLWLNDTQMADCTPLAGLKQLQYLWLSNTQVSDCAPLAGLNQLQYLDLSNTQVVDCVPLAGLKKLQTLNLSSTQVADCSPLAGLKQLQTLNLNNTQVTDISALDGIVKLRVLGVKKGKQKVGKRNTRPPSRHKISQ